MHYEMVFFYEIGFYFNVNDIQVNNQLISRFECFMLNSKHIALRFFEPVNTYLTNNNIIVKCKYKIKYFKPLYIFLKNYKTIIG